MILVFILPIVKAVQLIDQKGDIMLNLQHLEQLIVLPCLRQPKSYSSLSYP